MLSGVSQSPSPNTVITSLSCPSRDDLQPLRASVRPAGICPTIPASETMVNTCDTSLLPADLACHFCGAFVF